MDDARFVAMLGTDVGVIAVPAGSPYYSLSNLTDALKKDPSKVVGEGDGTGSWDHIRYLEIAKEGGVKNLHGLRWVHSSMVAAKPLHRCWVEKLMLSQQTSERHLIFLNLTTFDC